MSAYPSPPFLNSDLAAGIGEGPDSLSVPWSAAVDISPIDRTVVSNLDPQGRQDAGGKVKPNVLCSRFPQPHFNHASCVFSPSLQFKCQGNFF